MRYHPISSYKTVRLGSQYGGWYVPVNLLTPNMICYAVGVGEDTSFDEILATDYQCNVFAFDPTPRAIKYAVGVVERVERFRFYPVGFWDADTVLKFYAPENSSDVSHSAVNVSNGEEFFEAECWRIDSAFERLGHQSIDLLKLDIEGAEYRVVRQMLELGISPKILCLELHRADTFKETTMLVDELVESGYHVAAIDAWDLTLVHED